MRLMLFNGSRRQAADAAAAWVERCELPGNATRIMLSQSVFLYRGGDEIFVQAGLEPQYGLVRKLLGENGETVGYALYRFEHHSGMQGAEFAIRSSAIPHGSLLLSLFPHPDDVTLSDPLDGASKSIPRLAVSTYSFPSRRPSRVSVDCACSIIGNDTPTELFSYLEAHGLEITPESREIMIGSWAQTSIKERLLDIFGLYRAECFDIFGHHFSIHTVTQGWPIVEPTLPGLGGAQDYDLNNERHRAGVRNVLANVPFHSKLYELSPAQEELLEAALLDIGLARSTERGYPGDNTPWIGKTESGQMVYGAGAIHAGSSWIHFVNIVGGATIGAAVYRDTGCYQRLGEVAAVLWKSHNHDGYIKPELQKGIGLVVSQ